MGCAHGCVSEGYEAHCISLVHIQANWDDLDIDDVDVRLKWAGLFHRKKRTPGKFMMRLKVCWAQGIGSSRPLSIASGCSSCLH